MHRFNSRARGKKWHACSRSQRANAEPNVRRCRLDPPNNQLKGFAANDLRWRPACSASRGGEGNVFPRAGRFLPIEPAGSAAIDHPPGLCGCHCWLAQQCRTTAKLNTAGQASSGTQSSNRGLREHRFYPPALRNSARYTGSLFSRMRRSKCVRYAMSCSAGTSGTQRPLQMGVRGQLLQRRVEVFLHVGPEVERAAGLKRPLDVNQQRLAQHATLLMPLLPPRIGKVDMHRRERGVGQELAEHPQGVALTPLPRSIASALPKPRRQTRHTGGQSRCRENSPRVWPRPPSARKAPCPSQSRPLAAPAPSRAVASQGRGNCSTFADGPTDRDTDRSFATSGGP